MLEWNTTLNSTSLSPLQRVKLWGIKNEPCSHKVNGQTQNAHSLFNFPPAFIQTTAASYINYFPLCHVNYDSFCKNELFCKKKKKEKILNGQVHLWWSVVWNRSQNHFIIRDGGCTSTFGKLLDECHSDHYSQKFWCIEMQISYRATWWPHVWNLICILL